MKVAALWSGGKDSALACHKAMANGLDVSYIMTFIWDKPSSSHPLLMTLLQSKALRIPSYWEKIKPPYFDAYRQAIGELKEDYGIEGIVTGDISYVDSFHGNWIDDVCKDTGVKVIKPLWEQDRLTLVEELVDKGFRVIFTSVKKPWFNEEWIGREIDTETIEELKTLNRKTGMDICGENGEYHTMTIDAPFYKNAITVSKFETEETDNAFVMKPLNFTNTTRKKSNANHGLRSQLDD